ncbi:MAG TPA: M14 family zinc carboxypeptidase [Solirubrobacter sp.]|nr:M14 family zinc carboxypeptidase [Solirubrobacter sp.]
MSARIAAVFATASVSLGLAATAQAQQVTGLEVRQHDGFATLTWDPVPGATDYQIERSGVIVGVWRPNRQINQDEPAFADAGFTPGDTFQWRVRARMGSTPLEFSDPVTGATLPKFGDPNTPGENLRTQWEDTNAAQFTNDVNEYAYTAALDAASDRVRVVEIGRTLLGRPINMFIIGYPKPRPTVQAISNHPAALLNCNVHGNEPSSREGCLIMARELAFSNDPRTLDILSNMTVLIVPAINGDGRAANTRGNSTGQDLNRDHSLLRQPETFALSAMVRDYTPEVAYDGHEFGNSQAGDLPTLMPRHLNVAEPIFSESKSLIENWLYVHGSEDGWWYCPYGCQNGGAVGLSQETILRNTMGLKNTVSMLLEARSSGGQTRPNEAIAANNRRRKTYSAIYTMNQLLDYYRANLRVVRDAIKESIQFQKSNTGRIVFRGSYDVPAFPAPHPGEAPPPQEPADGVLDPPPCGYLVTDEQMASTQDNSLPAADRLEAHGIKVQRRGPRGWFVPMKQELRGLVPLLLDGEAAEPMVAAQRVDC